MSKYETVNVTRDGAVARVAFARPDSLNAMNGQMRREFYAAAREINMDDAIRVVVLTGEGRAFGAGADLADDSGGSGIMAGAQTRDDLVHEFKPGVLAIAEAPKVWVAAINGPCAGISYSYAMACDLVVMADDAYLYQPFSAIGLIPDGGSTWLLQKLIGSRRAFELMVLGEKLGADKALEWGMANRVFNKAAFSEEAMAFAEDLAGRSPLALRYTKEALRFAATASLGDTIVKEADLQASSQKKIIFATFSQAHEGLDIPTLDTVILASPKSDITQSIGRIMRETKGKKNNPHIYDIHDPWSIFTAMYYKRMKVYRQGGFKVHGKVEEEKKDEFPQGKCLFL